MKKEASFAGIDFYVIESRETYGKRNAIFEFSNRDEPYIESLGRKARRYSIEGFFEGSEAKKHSEDFIKACESQEKADLIHPFIEAIIPVSLDDTLEITRHTRDINYVSFSANFIEKGTIKPILLSQNLEAMDASGDLLDSAKSGFASAMNLSDIAGMASSAIDQVTDYISEVTGFIKEAARLTTMSALAINEIGYSLKKLENEIASALNAPFEAADLLSDSLEKLSAFEFNKLKKLRALALIGQAERQTSDNPGNSETTRRIQRVNKAVSDFVALTAIAHGIREIHHLNSGEPDQKQADPWELSSTQKSLIISENFPTDSDPETIGPDEISEVLEPQEFISYATITELKESLAETLEEISDNSSEDPVLFPATLRAMTTVQTLNISSERFPRTKKIEIKQDIPLIVFSYHNQQDRELLLRLNALEFPYFIPAGTMLEVVENAVTKNQ